MQPLLPITSNSLGLGSAKEPTLTKIASPFSPNNYTFKETSTPPHLPSSASSFYELVLIGQDSTLSPTDLGSLVPTILTFTYNSLHKSI